MGGAQFYEHKDPNSTHKLKKSWGRIQIRRVLDKNAEQMAPLFQPWRLQTSDLRDWEISEYSAHKYDVKPAIVRRDYKRRILEMHLKVKDQ